MDESPSGSDVPWIEWFCGQRGNEFLCEVEESFIVDKFNLTGLSDLMPAQLYRHATDMILDYEPDITEGVDEQMIEQAARRLYGLIHARYILTNQGLSRMLDKYRRMDFGVCPRVLCQEQPVLPIGVSDNLGVDSVKLFCPLCNEVYTPRSSRFDELDGAYFGTTFPHMLFAVYPEYRPPQNAAKYTPRIYGFKIHRTGYGEMLARHERALQLQAQSKAAAAAAANISHNNSTSKA
eukprot:m.76499 g.76499  ORF g.76499 m.76499 type:complete len:236 (+) comp14641_c3_seq4:269-976(+)